MRSTYRALKIPIDAIPIQNREQKCICDSPESSSLTGKLQLGALGASEK
jgi:hypothetical protein